MTKAAKLIAFEGIDNSGKTTVLRAVHTRLTQRGIDIVACGELESPLRDELLEMLRSGGSPFLKTYLFAVDRAWTYERVLLPAIQEGKHVFWDRYVDSAIAYRAAELIEESSLIDLQFVKDINSPFMPADETIFFDINVDTAFGRAEVGTGSLPYDRSMLEKVNEEYLSLSKVRGYHMVDAKVELSELTDSVERVVERIIAGGQE